MEELFEYIIEKTKGFVSESELEKFFASIEANAEKLAFTKTSQANFERIVKSVFDVRAFVSEALKYPHYIEITTLVAHYSNFLTDVIVRSPGNLYQILTPSVLISPLDEEKLKREISQGLARLKTFSSKVKFLRRLKNKTVLKIAVRDFLRLSDLENVTRELSVLANEITAALFPVALAETFKRKEIPETKVNYVISALGKLGGGELNYSSDIDLIFFYDKNKKIGNAGYDVFEILSEAISLFAEVATEMTADGFLYRVDFRLRSDGKYSPLIKSMRDYIYYYETRGENWERQMLLKLAYVAGEETLFEKFREYLTPFIFPSNLSLDYFENVRKMKSEIEKSAKNTLDIKKISGGIRDVEFSVQVLQIINGKKIPAVRDGNTLSAIEKLKRHKLLTETESETLASCYRHYRKIEHFLQLVNDTQTHVIPEKGETLTKLSSYLGFKKPETFFKDLRKKRTAVRKIFDSITLEKSGAVETSENIAFADSKKAARNLRYILKGENLSGAKSFDKITLELASKIEEPLLSELATLYFLDKALENFAKILSVVKFPSVFIRELSDGKFLRLFLRLCESSEKFVNTILQKPEFIEDFISRAALLSDLQAVKDVPKLVFYLLTQFNAGVIEPMQIGKELAANISEKVSALSEKFFGEQVFVASLGSAAQNKMTFSSDVDLLIIADEKKADAALQENAQKFLLELNSAIAPFSADLRLRPDGESSMLIRDISAVAKYFEKRITSWELIAFAKARFVAGNTGLFEKFVRLYVEKISNIDNDGFLKSLREIYSKLLLSKTKFIRSFDIKYSHGGITTIDFIALPQFLLSATPRQIERVLLNPDESAYGKRFEKIRVEYYKTIYALQSAFDTSKHILPADETKAKEFEVALERLNLIEVYANLEKLKSDVIKEFETLYASK